MPSLLPISRYAARRKRSTLRFGRTGGLRLRTRRIRLAVESLNQREEALARGRGDDATEDEINRYKNYREELNLATEALLVHEAARRAANRQLDDSAEHVADLTRRYSQSLPIQDAVRDARRDSTEFIEQETRRIRQQIDITERERAKRRETTQGQKEANAERERGFRFLRQLGDALDETEEGLDRETRRLRRNAEARRRVNEEVATGTRRLRGLLAGLQTVGAFRGAGLALERVVTDFDSATTAGGRFRALLPLVSGAVGGLVFELQQLGQRALREVLVGAAQLETGMVRLETQIGLTRSETSALREDIENLAVISGRNAQDLADAAFFIQSGGQRGASANEILEASAKGAAIALGSERDIAQLLTSSLNAYGTESLSAARASEILLSTVREGALDANELSSSLGRALAPAAELGVELDELGAIVAFYTRFGVTAAEATTAFRSVLEGILKPSEQARDILGEIGISIEDLQRFVGERGLTHTLQLLRRELGNDITTLTGFLGRQEAVGLTLALTGERASEANDIFGRLTQETDNLDAAFSRVSETTEFRWNQTLASLRDIGYEIADSVLPAVNLGLDLVTDLFGRTGPQDFVDEMVRLAELRFEEGRYAEEIALLELLNDADRAPETLDEIAAALERIVGLGAETASTADLRQSVVDFISGDIDAEIQRISDLRGQVEGYTDLIGTARQAQAQLERDLASRTDINEAAAGQFREAAQAEIDGLITEVDRGSARLDQLEGEIESTVDQVLAIAANMGVALRSLGEQEIERFTAALTSLGFSEDAVGELVREATEDLEDQVRVARDAGVVWFDFGNDVQAAVPALSDAAGSIEDMQTAADSVSLDRMRSEIASTAATSAVLALSLGDIAFGMAVLESATVQISGIDGSTEARIERITDGLLGTADAQDQVSAAANRGGGSQNRLNEQIDEAIRLLAEEQGILATTLREYNDFWTDAQRASERALEDQSSALERLERDAFRTLEGLEGETRQARELELRRRLDDLRDGLEREEREEERFYEDRIERARDVADRIRDTQQQSGGGSGGGSSTSGVTLDVDAERRPISFDGDLAFDLSVNTPRILEILDELRSQVDAESQQHAAELEAITIGLGIHATPAGLLDGSEIPRSGAVRSSLDDAAILSTIQDLWAAGDAASQVQAAELEAITIGLGIHARGEPLPVSSAETLATLQTLYRSSDRQVAGLARNFAEIVGTFGMSADAEHNQVATRARAVREGRAAYRLLERGVADQFRRDARVRGRFGLVDLDWSRSQVQGHARRQATAMNRLLSTDIERGLTRPGSRGRGRFNLIGIDWNRNEVIARARREARAINRLIELQMSGILQGTAHVNSRAVVDNFIVDEEQIERDARLVAQGINERIQLAMDDELRVNADVGVQAQDQGGQFGGGSAPAGVPGLLGGNGQADIQRALTRAIVAANQEINGPGGQRQGGASGPALDDVSAQWQRQRDAVQQGSRSWVVGVN